MARIDREAIVANRRAIAVRVVGPFALMAIAAETLQWAEPEGVPVAFVRRVMIGDRRRREAIPREAKGAQRLDAELMMSAPSPALQ